MEKINAEDELPNVSQTTLQGLMQQLGFRYRKRSRNPVLIEKNEIIVWRRKYLTLIRKYREEGRTIYYLDETWCNAGHVPQKSWSDDTIKTARQAFNEGLSTGLKDPIGKGKRIIVLHIGSENGFVDGGLLLFESSKDGDYHKEMNSVVFEDWLKRIVNRLDANSVIVMDNASYHSRRNERVPTNSWKKKDISDWLKSKGIYNCEPDDLLKAELLVLAKEYLKNNPNFYVVDKIIEDSNRIILRLPPYHCHLNPIELVWADVKKYVAQNNKTFKFSDMKILFEQGLERITPLRWKNCCEHVITKEEENYRLDDNIENIQLRFTVNTDSLSESDFNSSDSDTDNEMF